MHQRRASIERVCFPAGYSTEFFSSVHGRSSILIFHYTHLNRTDILYDQHKNGRPGQIVLQQQKIKCYYFHMQTLMSSKSIFTTNNSLDPRNGPSISKALGKVIKHLHTFLNVTKKSNTYIISIPGTKPSILLFLRHPMINLFQGFLRKQGIS